MPPRNDRSDRGSTHQTKIPTEASLWGLGNYGMDDWSMHGNDRLAVGIDVMDLAVVQRLNPLFDLAPVADHHPDHAIGMQHFLRHRGHVAGGERADLLRVGVVEILRQAELDDL